MNDNKGADTSKKSTEELIAAAEELLPEWASGLAHGKVQVNAQLCTRDGRKIGNATVTGFVERFGREFVQVVTDMGSEACFTHAELDEVFYPPKWIKKGSEAAKEVPNEAAPPATEGVDDGLPELTDGGFLWNDIDIQNPTLSSCGRFTVSPEVYGFVSYGTGGGCMAWRLECKGGESVLLTDTSGIALPGTLEGALFWMGLYDAEDQELSLKTLLVGVDADPEFMKGYIDALAEESLNTAVRVIQDRFGITTGDFAGVYFSGQNGDDLRKMLVDYAKAEIEHNSIKG